MTLLPYSIILRHLGGGMQMRRAASFFAKLVIVLIPSLTDGLSEVTPAQLLAWPDNSYDRYIAVDKESLNGIY